MWNLQMQTYDTLFAIFLQRNQMIIALHFLYRNRRTIKLFSSLLLHFLNLSLKGSVLIFGKHILTLVPKIFNIVSVSLQLKNISEGKIWIWLSNFVSFKNICVGIFLVGFYDAEIFCHVLDVDWNGFIIDEFFVDALNCASLTRKFYFVIVISEHWVRTKEILAIPSKQNNLLGTSILLIPIS